MYLYGKFYAFSSTMFFWHSINTSCSRIYRESIPNQEPAMKTFEDSDCLLSFLFILPILATAEPSDHNTRKYTSHLLNPCVTSTCHFLMTDRIIRERKKKRRKAFADIMDYAFPNQLSKSALGIRASPACMYVQYSTGTYYHHLQILHQLSTTSK